jgi:hypothetical protein
MASTTGTVAAKLADRWVSIADEPEKAIAAAMSEVE